MTLVKCQDCRYKNEDTGEYYVGAEYLYYYCNVKSIIEANEILASHPYRVRIDGKLLVPESQFD